MQCVLAPLFHTNDAVQICNRGRDAALRRPAGAARRPYRSQSAAREIQAHIPFREARHRTSPSEADFRSAVRPHTAFHNGLKRPTIDPGSAVIHSTEICSTKTMKAGR